MMRLLLFILAFAACGLPAQAQSLFKDWAVLVVAGDYRASTGAPAEVFDNARRDISKALVGVGFSAENVIQASVRPNRYPDTKPLALDPPPTPFNAFKGVSQRAQSGCLLYFSSHGTPEGLVYGEVLLPPRALRTIIDQTCGARPTVVMISACFSGVFVPALAGPNRMILTAARPDRTSFGCGEDDVYPFFDTCILQTLPGVNDFNALATATQTCVAKREQELGMTPPSEPQISIGAELRTMLPLMRLEKVAAPG